MVRKRPASTPYHIPAGRLKQAGVLSAHALTLAHLAGVAPLASSWTLNPEPYLPSLARPQVVIVLLNRNEQVRAAAVQLPCSCRAAAARFYAAAPVTLAVAVAVYSTANPPPLRLPCHTCLA